MDHPAFHAFASSLLSYSTFLPFLITLTNPTVLHLFLGSLSNLSTLSVDSSKTRIFGFDPDEFNREMDRVTEQARLYALRTGMDLAESDHVKGLLRKYLIETEVRITGW